MALFTIKVKYSRNIWVIFLAITLHIRQLSYLTTQYTSLAQNIDSLTGINLEIDHVCFHFFELVVYYMCGPRDLSGCIDGLNVHAVLLSINLCIFDNIYNLASPHIDYNFMSGIISPDGLKSPIMSDELDLFRINGISALIHVD